MFNIKKYIINKNIDRVWGYETLLLNNFFAGSLTVKILTIKRGSTIDLHLHKNSDELLICITNGIHVISNENNDTILSTGDVVIVPRKTAHRVSFPITAEENYGHVVLLIYGHYDEHDVTMC